MTNLEEFLKESQSWTLEKRIKGLRIKYDNKK
jgi:hypothetical protein